MQDTIRNIVSVLWAPDTPKSGGRCRRGAARLRELTTALTLCTTTALTACSRAPEPESSQPRAEPSAAKPSAPVLAILRGRVVNPNGTPARETSIGFTGAALTAVDADGRFALSLPSWRMRAPVIYLDVRRELSDGTRRASVVLPSSTVSSGVELQWSANDDADLLVTLAKADPAAQAWLDAHRWCMAAWHEWLAVGEDPTAVAALWRRLAADIEATSDEHLRMLMQAGQFAVGRSDPEAGLDRRGVAEQALAELGVDNPRWALWPRALPTAIYEAGRWSALSSELDAAITTYPQAEVAASIALERYLEAIADGRWSQAEAIWAAVEARAELLQTSLGRVLNTHGPNRRLAPGKLMPAVCVEGLDGAPLCTDALEGLTLIELWTTDCKGCRESLAKLGELLPRLRKDGVEVELVTINTEQQGSEVASFLAPHPPPGRHGWVQAQARESLREQLEISSVPILVIVGADGRILDSTPTLRADILEDRLRHWHAAR